MNTDLFITARDDIAASIPNPLAAHALAHDFMAQHVGRTFSAADPYWVAMDDFLAAVTA